MKRYDDALARRRILQGLVGSALLGLSSASRAQQARTITVWKDPNCGCCTGWIDHLKLNGFTATIIDTSDVQSIKSRRRVPADLASCHTAEIAGYTIEGHVPASAIIRLLEDKPVALGLAVPGMPVGSPGMEGGRPEDYDVILFGEGARKSFGRFNGVRPV